MFNLINRAIVEVQAFVTTSVDRASARQEGQALIEYGLIAALIGVALIVGLGAVAGALYDPNVTVVAAVVGPPAVPAHFATGDTPGIFNQVIFALSGGTQGK